MSTALQEDLAEAIVRNKKLPRDKRLNRGELVKSVGYAPLSASKRATEIIEAKGVKDALESQGLTKDLITKALVEDIIGKPKKRYSELSLGAEILGMKIKPTDTTPQSVTNNITQIIINPPHAIETRNQSNGETVSSVASTPES